MQVRPPGLGTHPSFVLLCLHQSRGMLGGGIFVADGSTPQISWAYSVMVLSLENLPEHAMFLMTFLVHSRGSWEEERQCQQSVPHLAVPACSLAGHQLCTLGWFKGHGLGLLKQQNLPHSASCPYVVVSVRRAPQEHTHSSSLLHCYGQGPHPSPSAAGSSYHEQLVHLTLAFNVGLVVGKHLKPETQSRVRLGYCLLYGPSLAGQGSTNIFLQAGRA